MRLVLIEESFHACFVGSLEFQLSGHYFGQKMNKKRWRAVVIPAHEVVEFAILVVYDNTNLKLKPFGVTFYIVDLNIIISVKSLF